MDGSLSGLHSYLVNVEVVMKYARAEEYRSYTGKKKDRWESVAGYCSRRYLILSEEGVGREESTRFKAGKQVVRLSVHWWLVVFYGTGATTRSKMLDYVTYYQVGT